MKGRLPPRYRIIEEVGQGGMAVVYRAFDEALGRQVAIKVLHAHLLEESESTVRLKREAQAVAKLHHDNIVQVFDYSGEDAEGAFIVTEFVEGCTLRQFLGSRKAPLPPEVAALLAIEVGQALEHAHSLGIIHRDVKPENVMVRDDGVLKLMDFGVAQVMDLERMTVTGQLLGSPAYMAPELLNGKPVDARTDLFSVGILLYQLCTNELPFSGRNPAETMKRVSDGKFADPRSHNRKVPDPLARIITRALARNPDDRYKDMASFTQDLRRFAADAGLSDTAKEVRAYFANPDTYEQSVTERMLEALVRNGAAARSNRQTARALELWNRALVIDPNNPEVLAELRRLANRQNLRRATIAVACSLVLGAGGFFALTQAGANKEGEAALLPVSLAQGTEPSAKPPLAQTASPPQDPAGDSKPTAGKDEGRSRLVMATRTNATPSADEGKRAGRIPMGETVKAAATGRETEPARPHRGPRVASAGPEKSQSLRETFELVPIPKNVDIFVNGVFRQTYDYKKTTLTLDWTRDHKVTFRNDCCLDFDVSVGPSHDDGNRKLIARMTGKPAYLTVTTLPPTKGNVLVEEADPEETRTRVKQTAMLDDRIYISFAKDRDLSKQLSLTIFDSEGRQIGKGKVNIRAGNHLKPVVSVTL